jgi:hypothetical protein
MQQHLAGINWQNKAAMPNLPGENTEPLGLRLFVSWLGLAHTTPGSTAALYLAPVAFMNNRERKDWYDASGQQSKLFGHTDDFLEYAAEAFRSGKQTVMGLFTPFFATLHDARSITNQGADSANSSGYSPRDVFNQHHKLCRFGCAVLIRHIQRNGSQAIQVVLFCPWDRHQWIKEAREEYEWRLLLWKESLLNAVDTWATGHGVSICDGYTGGSRFTRKDREPDSVEMCAQWLHDVMTAPNKSIPRAAEEGGEETEAWEWEELCRFTRLQNWPGRAG